VFLDKIKTTPI